jgi:hypothetical protein
MPLPLVPIAVGAGLGLLGSLFGGGGQSQTTRTGLAPEAERLLAPYRQGAIQAGFNQADPFAFMNPFIPQQIEALRGEAEAFLPRAMGQIASGTTLQGAGGGTREAAFQGAAAGEIGRGLLSSISGLQAQGFQSSLQAALQDAARRGQLGLFGLPQIQSGSSRTQQNPFLGMLGGAALGAGF